MYANSKTIDWALQDGLGSWFWQHNWGSPQGYTHPAAHLHQVEIDKRKVAGVGVDLNHILQAPIRSVGLTNPKVGKTYRQVRICQQTRMRHFGEQSWTETPSKCLAGLTRAAAADSQNFYITIR